MKKIFLLIVFMLTLVGCDDNVYYWNFKKNYTEIKEISIIKIDEYKSSYQVISEQRIKIIDNSQYENFYNDIQNMKMKKTPLQQFVYPNNYCFLITYDDKNYCILSEYGSGYLHYNDEDNRFGFEYRKLDFDEVEFLNLLIKYLDDYN